MFIGLWQSNNCVQNTSNSSSMADETRRRNPRGMLLYQSMLNDLQINRRDSKYSAKGLMVGV